MRISDWSSYVCSSDLDEGTRAGGDRDHGSERRSHPRHPCAIGAHGRLRAGGCDGPGRCHREGARRARRRRRRPAVSRRTQLRSEEHTSELQSLMRISYAVFCLKKKKNKITRITSHEHTKQNTTHELRTIEHDRAV